MVAGDGLEVALAVTEERVDSALKAAAAVTRELRKAKTGAGRGQLRELRRALTSASVLAEDAARATQASAASFELDEQEYLASGSYAKELLHEAAAQHVTMFESDERLLCYPSLIKVLASDAAVEIDRRREKRLRPSVLVRLLSAAQARPHDFGRSRSWRAWRPRTTWCVPGGSNSTVWSCDSSRCGTF